jgi:hypothetical protein
MGAGACTPATLPAQPTSSAPLQTGAIPPAPAGSAPLETAVVVQGSPTEVYALVARGALACWFGADGALKASHVFQAEAAPPSRGGAAEIVLHERDVSLRDQRGPRAFQVSFANNAGGVRVGITTIRIQPPLAGLMVKDVEVWAGGGSGCQVRALNPPQSAAPAQSQAKTAAKRPGQR